ncbi:hypothetical protein ABT040_39670 [Streptomyces sp. NPDC002688]|uniref:Mu transposase domain-containing protein n=1 Tax=Streptomyces sp. NPDC002688 TaxID=3154423 RepID=UPI0033295656
MSAPRLPTRRSNESRGTGCDADESRYSVPARFIGHKVRVVLRSTELIAYDGRVEIAFHPG